MPFSHFRGIRNSSSFVLCSENPAEVLVKRMAYFRTNAFYSFDQYLLGASCMPGAVQALVMWQWIKQTFSSCVAQVFRNTWMLFSNKHRAKVSLRGPRIGFPVPLHASFLSENLPLLYFRYKKPSRLLSLLHTKATPHWAFFGKLIYNNNNSQNRKGTFQKGMLYALSH